MGDKVMDVLESDDPNARRDFTRNQLNDLCYVWMRSASEACEDSSGNNLTLFDSGRPYCPTWKQYGVCYSIDKSISRGIMTPSVLSADIPSSFGPRQIRDHVKYLLNRFGVFGDFRSILERSALWPVKAQYPAIGSNVVNPLLMGVLDDTLSFRMSQRMKMAFPGGSLITWQGMQHGLTPWFQRSSSFTGALPCVEAQLHYLKTKELPRNGMVCRAKVAGIDFEFPFTTTAPLDLIV